MSIDRWIEDGVGGEDRKRYEERLSYRAEIEEYRKGRLAGAPAYEERLSVHGMTAEQRRYFQEQIDATRDAIFAQVERETIALRKRLGLD